MSDLTRTLAFAFRRKGVEAMNGAELRMLLAYDLRWFAPEDAKRVVLRGIEAGLLAESADVVKPLFDIRTVDIPLNFRPSVEMLDDPIAPRPATLAAAPAPTDEIDHAAEEERRKRGLLMSVEVAKLVVRRRAGEDVTAEAAALEASVLRG